MIRSFLLAGFLVVATKAYRLERGGESLEKGNAAVSCDKIVQGAGPRNSLLKWGECKCPAGSVIAGEAPECATIRGQRYFPASLPQQLCSCEQGPGHDSSQYVFYKLDMAKYPLARCLDGTPGAFHVLGSSSSASQKKWIINHNGGGWCSMDVPLSEGGMVDHCYNRSLGYLGSSKFMANMPNTALNDWLSVDPKANPLMHDWNKVNLIYCDGGSFSGRKLSDTIVEGQPLYFRGSYILEAIIDTLLYDFGMNLATDVVVGGYSAGSLAAYLHTEQWRRALPETAFMATMGDGGIFMDWAKTKPAQSTLTYAAAMRGNFHAFNISSGVNDDCVATYSVAGGDIANCFFAEHTLPFITTPVFGLQSVVDAWQLENILGLSKPFADDSHAELGNEYLRLLTSKVLDNLVAKPNGGAFVDSCIHHCGMFSNLMADGVRMADAFPKWYTMQRVAWQDGHAPTGRKSWWQAKAFPCKECCPKGEGGGDPNLDAFSLRMLSYSVL